MSQLASIREEIRQSLMQSNYEIFEETDPQKDMSFDLIAQHESHSIYTPNLLIKLLINIDSIKPHIINEIKLISLLTKGIPLFIGKENRHSALRDDSIYIRKDIFAVNLKTFQKIISYPRSPIALAYAKQGGFFHDVDNEKLKELRKKYGFTRQVLAEKLKISSKSISHYENHNMRASIENMDQLERVFGESVIKPINFFEFLHDSKMVFKLNEALHRRISAKTRDFMSSINEIIEETGYQVFWPKSVPFDLCVYKEDEKSDTIKDFTLIGGTECGDMSSNSENCVNQDFLKKIDQDSAIIYDEEFYDEKIAKSRQIPYLQPKDLRKLEDIKEFKKFIRRKKKG